LSAAPLDVEDDRHARDAVARVVDPRDERLRSGSSGLGSLIVPGPDVDLRGGPWRRGRAEERSTIDARPRRDDAAASASCVASELPIGPRHAGVVRTYLDVHR